MTDSIDGSSCCKVPTCTTVSLTAQQCHVNGKGIGPAVALINRTCSSALKFHHSVMKITFKVGGNHSDANMTEAANFISKSIITTGIKHSSQVMLPTLLLFFEVNVIFKITVEYFI